MDLRFLGCWCFAFDVFFKRLDFGVLAFRSRGIGLKPFGFRRLQGLWMQGLPVAVKPYLFKNYIIETIIRNPKKVGLFGYR